MVKDTASCTICLDRVFFCFLGFFLFEGRHSCINVSNFWDDHLIVSVPWEALTRLSYEESFTSNPPSQQIQGLPSSLSRFLVHCHIVINKLLLCLLVSEGRSWRNLMVWASRGCFATIQEEMENIVSRMRKDQQHPRKFNWEVEFLSRIDRKPMNTPKITDKRGKAGNRYNLCLQRKELSLNFIEVLSLRIKMDWIQDTTPIDILLPLLTRIWETWKPAVSYQNGVHLTNILL